MPFHKITDPARLHALLDALLLVESDLDLTVLLRSVVAAASELVGARYGALGISDPSGHHLSDFITYGITEEERRRMGDLPTGKGLLGEVLLHPIPLRSSNVASDPKSVGFPPGHPPMVTFLGVPVLTGDGRVFGNLYVTDKHDGTPFHDEDEDLLEAFGRTASLIIDEVRLRKQLHDLTLSEERERMARDLHDTVIQRLFAVGLTLQATMASDLSPTTRRQIDRCINELDATIREIRTTIFEIVQERQSASGGLRTRLLSIVDEVTSRLGLAVDISFEGAIDTMVGPICADTLTKVLREVLSNVVRHAQASSASVIIGTDGDSLDLVITDDGIGFDPTGTTGRGLRNLSERAAEMGGEFSVGRHGERGTIVTWTARRLD